MTIFYFYQLLQLQYLQDFYQELKYLTRRILYKSFNKQSDYINLIKQMKLKNINKASTKLFGVKEVCCQDKCSYGSIYIDHQNTQKYVVDKQLKEPNKFHKYTQSKISIVDNLKTKKECLKFSSPTQIKNKISITKQTNNIINNKNNNAKHSNNIIHKMNSHVSIQPTQKNKIRKIESLNTEVSIPRHKYTHTQTTLDTQLMDSIKINTQPTLNFNTPKLTNKISVFVPNVSKGTKLAFQNHFRSGSQPVLFSPDIISNRQGFTNSLPTSFKFGSQTKNMNSIMKHCPKMVQSILINTERPLQYGKLQTKGSLNQFRQAESKNISFNESPTSSIVIQKNEVRSHSRKFSLAQFLNTDRLSIERLKIPKKQNN